LKGVEGSASAFLPPKNTTPLTIRFNNQQLLPNAGRIAPVRCDAPFPVCPPHHTDSFFPHPLKIVEAVECVEERVRLPDAPQRKLDELAADAIKIGFDARLAERLAKRKPPTQSGVFRSRPATLRALIRTPAPRQFFVQGATRH
jgi:hypothetical protein